MKYQDIEKVLGGQKVLHKRIKSQMDLIELSNIGISKSALLRLAKYMSFSIPQISMFLPITERTIQRYNSNKHFNPVVSEHIIQIARVAVRGSEIFEDKELFLQWMSSPSTALSNKPPKSFLSSKLGTDMVLDELGRIEHGVYA